MKSRRRVNSTVRWLLIRPAGHRILVIELIKLLVASLGKKRSLRIFAVLIFLATSYLVLITLDWIDWTWWWVIPTLLGLHLSTEALIATFSMTHRDERNTKKNEKVPTAKSKKRK